MKILYLTLQPPLDATQVATGNQVRSAGLLEVLRDDGHEVCQLSPAPKENRSPGTDYYASVDGLASQIEAYQPDVILVGYWILLTHLPDSTVPVVLDFIAPRLLEAMYQEPGVLASETRQLLSLLPKADFFLVGNQRQSDMLLTLLLLSGFDCREQAPIAIIPISTCGTPAAIAAPTTVASATGATKTEIRLVSAGVDWPWRQSEPYLEQVREYCAAHAELGLLHLHGSYPGSGDGNESGLASYAAMQASIAGCHVGLELGLRNTEREFSHSFRMLEYLQQGLPVIINSWLPIAATVRDYDAGWIIDSPEELPALLDSIRLNPELLKQKAAGSHALACGPLSYRQSAMPLLAWLKSPLRPLRDAKAMLVKDQAPRKVLSIAPSGKTRNIKAALGQAYKLLFCRKRPQPAADILMVTRADLFPTDHGAAVKIVRTAESLSRLGRDVYLCTDNRAEYYHFHQGVCSTSRYPLWLRLFAMPWPIPLLRLLFRGFPQSNAFLYYPLTDASYSLRSLWLATRYGIGAYIAEFPAYVRPCRFVRSLFGGKLMLVEHNVEYERLRTQVDNLSERSFARLKQTELHMCALADAIVTVSDNDRDILIGDGVAAAKLHTIPHGVDLHEFKTIQHADVRSQYGIPAGHCLLVYHGTYAYPPNLQAMKVMAGELLPRLQQLGLKVSVLAIGSKPPAWELHPNIHFTGSIDKLASVLPAADIAVVPLLDGGGTRMKILDYFAAGVPVISTAKGIEGIPVSNGVQALISDDFDEICQAVLRLQENPEQREQLIKAASAFVDTLSWDAIAARYLPLLNPES